MAAILVTTTARGLADEIAEVRTPGQVIASLAGLEGTCAGGAATRDVPKI